MLFPFARTLEDGRSIARHGGDGASLWDECWFPGRGNVCLSLIGVELVHLGEVADQWLLVLKVLIEDAPGIWVSCRFEVCVGTVVILALVPIVLLSRRELSPCFTGLCCTSPGYPRSMYTLNAFVEVPFAVIPLRALGTMEWRWRSLELWGSDLARDFVSFQLRRGMRCVNASVGGVLAPVQEESWRVPTITRKLF